MLHNNNVNNQTMLNDKELIKPSVLNSTNPVEILQKIYNLVI
jgi:hypothetical protein